MTKLTLPLIALLVIQCCFIPVKTVVGQKRVYTDLRYISPEPGSNYIMPENNIALRQGEVLDTKSFTKGMLDVYYSRGDIFTGKVVFSDDKKTLMFLPDEPYPLGSKVYVSLKEGLRTKSGLYIQPVNFSFEVTKKVFPLDRYLNDPYINDDVPELFGQPPNRSVGNTQIAKDNNYPDGYAFGTVLVDDDPPDGYYFYSPYNDWGWFPDTDPYISIIDKYATPVYYRKIAGRSYDLKIQRNGLLSFYSLDPFWGNVVMDSSYNIIEKYNMGNGYSYTDFHEFQMLENGHVFVMTFDGQIIDMSQYVAGGDPQAFVMGFVFQEQDVNHNVVFQWRSWDHYEITETGPEVDLLSNEIDYVHGNTIEVESDTSLLISARNFHEITKIDRNTGEIIWRLGGSQNQFDFGSDTLRFSRQHDARRIFNGHVTAFDNGTFHPDPKFSSVVEYAINPIEMTATLIHRFRHDPDWFGMAMGNGFRTPDSTYVVGWGTHVPGITEFDLDNNVLWELDFEGMSYRDYRFPWKTNYFTTNADTLQFAYIWYQDSTIKTIQVHNPQPVDIQITSTYNMTDYFKVLDNLPVIVPSGETADLKVMFNPDSVGTFNDIFTINSDINNDTLVQRIAQQVRLTGNATYGQGIAEKTPLQMMISPNPVQSELRIGFNNGPGQCSITILNIQGATVKKQDIKAAESVRLDVSNLKPGVYLIRILTVNESRLVTDKFIKN